MKKLVTLIALIVAGVSTPAFAANNSNFVGPRVGVTVGSSDVSNAKNVNNFAYSAVVGLDAPVGNFLVVGGEADVANFAGSSRDIGIYARVGVAPVSSVMLYAKGGYSNFRDIPTTGKAAFIQSGFGVGGGVQYALTKHTYVGLEGMHKQYGGGVSKNSGALTMGVRF